MIFLQGYDGRPSIEVNAAYHRQHPCKEGTIEWMLVDLVQKKLFEHLPGATLMRNLQPYFVRLPNSMMSWDASDLVVVS